VSNPAPSLKPELTLFTEIKYGLGIPFNTIPLHNLELFFQVIQAWQIQTTKTLTGPPFTVSLGNHPYVQLEPGINQDFHRLPIHAYLYCAQNQQVL
jgi:hypothetical protein